MGWLSVATSEEDGGLGCRPASVAVLARQAGATGINEPVAVTLVAAQVLGSCGTAQQKSHWLPPLLEGRLRAACAFAQPGATPGAEGGRLSGRCEFVLDADLSDLLLVQAETGAGLRWHVLAADAPGLEISRYPLLDGRGAATLRFEASPAEPMNLADAGTAARLAAGWWICTSRCRNRAPYWVRLCGL